MAALVLAESLPLFCFLQGHPAVNKAHGSGCHTGAGVSVQILLSCRPCGKAALYALKHQHASAIYARLCAPLIFPGGTRCLCHWHACAALALPCAAAFSRSRGKTARPLGYPARRRFSDISIFIPPLAYFARRWYYRSASFGLFEIYDATAGILIGTSPGVGALGEVFCFLFFLGIIILRR